MGGHFVPGRRRSICLYTPSIDPSGMGAHMVDLAAEFASDAEVSVMFRPTPGGQALLARAEQAGAATLALPSPRDPAFARLIVDFLEARPVDVFHVHSGLGWEDWDGARIARAVGCPAVLQTQHLPFLTRRPYRRHRFHHAIEEVDHLIAVSEGLRRTYERIGVPAHRWTTVPNGIAPRRGAIGRAAARRALGLDEDQPVVLSIGRLTHMKGQWHLIDAVPELVARFPTVRVLLLGDGPLRGDLVRRAAGLGVSGSVCFAGHRADARDLLDAADVFVLPSLHEGMPLAAIEAMEAALPVVATRVIGSQEVVVDGVTGALVRPSDPAALAGALIALLADPELRRCQGQAGRRRYLERHTRAGMAAATAAVYERVLQSVGREPAGAPA